MVVLLSKKAVPQIRTRPSGYASMNNLLCRIQLHRYHGSLFDLALTALLYLETCTLVLAGPGSEEGCKVSSTISPAQR